MIPPQGYTAATPGQVYRLQRSLYGLKQASRQWNIELTKFLIGKGFKQSKNDYSLFTRVKSDKVIFISVYVDDLLITGNDADGIITTKATLHSAFTIKDLGLACYFLGIELARSSQGTFLNKRKYILDILKDAGMTTAKPAPFPLPRGLHLSLHSREVLSDPSSYRRLIENFYFLHSLGLIYHIQCSYSASFFSNPDNHTFKQPYTF